MKESKIYYSVGALLYCPANNLSISRSLIEGKFGNHYSLALCLEDTINDNFVEQAEERLIRSLQKVYKARLSQPFFIPKIFIRVRSPKQISDLLKRLGEARKIITGIIVPKFDLSNADDYIKAVLDVNLEYEQTIYMMPIFESPAIIDLRNRYEILYSLKEKLDTVEEYILNIRVGGNDLCKMFGFRRHNNESIHNIKPVASIFTDIVTVFGTDYVISGPVWEYFNGENWDTGLKQELKEDILCGFIGKTVIHPNQIEVVHNAYKVSRKDLEDAKSILNWNTNSESLVSGSQAKERMNEYKTHCSWALKTIMLAEVYGVCNSKE